MSDHVTSDQSASPIGTYDAASGKVTLDPSTAAAQGANALVRLRDGRDHAHTARYDCFESCPAYEAALASVRAAGWTSGEDGGNIAVSLYLDKDVIGKRYEAGDGHVHHPPHYNGHPAGIECIDVIEHASHNVGAAIKYLWRVEWGTKPDAPKVQDLEKAAWYLQREIARQRRLEETDHG